MPHSNMRTYMTLSRRDEQLLMEEVLIEVDESLNNETVAVEEVVIDDNCDFYYLCMEDLEAAFESNEIVLNEYEVWSELTQPNFIKVAAEDLGLIDFQNLPGFVKVITEKQLTEDFGRTLEDRHEELVEGIKDLVQKWTFLREDTGNDDIDRGVENGLARAAVDLEDLLKKSEEQDDN